MPGSMPKGANQVQSVSKLRIKLLDRGLPGYIVAKNCGLPASRISEYATGKKAIPVHHLTKLCDYFECNPDDILGEAENQIVSSG